jgi:hypothetical protein
MATKKQLTPPTPAETVAPAALAPASRFPRPSFLGGLRSGVVRPVPGSLVVELADATGTDRVVLAAIRTAYGWNDETRLTRDEFLRLRDEWLAAPAREVSK